METEINTIIKNGLPVTARANVCGPEPDVGLPRGSVEDIEIYFLSGHEFKGPVSEEDMERIAQEILDYNPKDYLY